MSNLVLKRRYNRSLGTWEDVPTKFMGALAHHPANSQGTRPKLLYPDFSRSRVPHRGPLGGAVKRAFDLFVASTVLILLSPLLIITALLVRLTMGGPVLFAHRRIGWRGKTFKCYKF